MSRKAWTVFVIVQTLGQACMWLVAYTVVPSPRISEIGVILFFSGIVLSAPGDLVELWVVERFLSRFGLTPGHVALLETVAEIGINLAVWLLCARIYRAVQARHRADEASPTP